jgi:hypothetical protein
LGELLSWCHVPEGLSRPRINTAGSPGRGRLGRAVRDRCLSGNTASAETRGRERNPVSDLPPPTCRMRTWRNVRLVLSVDVIRSWMIVGRWAGCGRLRRKSAIGSPDGTSLTLCGAVRVTRSCERDPSIVSPIIHIAHPRVGVWKVVAMVGPGALAYLLFGRRKATPTPTTPNLNDV